MDTMMHFSNDNLCRFLTKDEMKVKAPYIFAEGATNPKCSSRYAFASTETIIDDLATLGWGVVDCKQQKNNKKTKGIYSYHQVAFQNPDIYISKINEDGSESIDCFPRIILLNSHDSLHSFRFLVGCFRLVCSNGLIISTQEFADVSIRHINYTIEELKRVVASAITDVEKQVASMNRMKLVNLSENQIKEMAVNAIKIRKGIELDKEIQVSEETIKDILTPVRDEDRGTDLWTIFNVLQEKVIKGNFSVTNSKGKERKQRAITSIGKDISINQKLYEMASSYAKAA